MVKPITQVSSREVYRNNWMTVREDSIRRQDGSAGIYGVVDKPDYALIIAVDGTRVGLVEQYRYPLGERRWEFLQGTAPDRADVEPTELAIRELREETGLTAGSFVVLGRLDIAAGMSSQRGGCSWPPISPQVNPSASTKSRTCTSSGSSAVGSKRWSGLARSPTPSRSPRTGNCCFGSVSNTDRRVMGQM